MFFVFCGANDLAAIWTYLQLRRFLGGAIELVTSEVLAHALRWEHRITPDGVTTNVVLGDGRVVRSDECRGALNRIELVPATFAPAAAADREYAGAEVRAFFASWLHALPGRVWNPATPAGLSGFAYRRANEWQVLASRSGFATRPAGSIDVPARRLLVIGESVIGDAAWAAPALALSRATKTPILGIALCRDGTFHSATTHPDLRTGGGAAIGALREQLFAEVHA